MWVTGMETGGNAAVARWMPIRFLHHFDLLLARAPWESSRAQGLPAVSAAEWEHPRSTLEGVVIMAI